MRIAVKRAMSIASQNEILTFETMVSRTRSSANSSPIKSGVAVDDSLNEQKEPCKVFIIPNGTQLGARILSLKHPKDNIKKRFFFCPTQGLYEFTRTSAPSSDPRSLFLTRFQHVATDISTGGPDDKAASQVTTGLGSGQVNKHAEIFIATPIDMAFILLAALTTSKSFSKAPNGKTLFQPLDDLLEDYMEEDKGLRFILKQGRQFLEAAAIKICDTVDAGDEKMLRLNEEKVLSLLLQKAERVAKSGLPPSLEERFVIRALAKPVLAVKREETFVSVVTDIAESETSLGTSEEDSQSSNTSSVTSTTISKASSTTLVDQDSVDATSVQIQELQRVRVAFSFITASYVPHQVATKLDDMLCTQKSLMDFTPLEEYHKLLTTLRAEAMASRSLSGFSNKRALEDEEGSTIIAEKKRKLEEEEKRKKAGESRGVRDLKKVNVVGMKKMSDFFSKATAVKAKT